MRETSQKQHVREGKNVVGFLESQKASGSKLLGPLQVSSCYP